MTVRLHCPACDVFWSGWTACWNCGQPGAFPHLSGGSPSAGSHGYAGARMAAVITGEYVDIEPLEQFLEQP